MQVVFKPPFQLRAPLAFREKLDSQSNLSKGYDAGIEGVGFHRGKPSLNMRIWLTSSIEFREHVGVNQVPCHSSIGRTCCLRLSKSSSAPAKGDSIRKSARFFRGFFGAISGTGNDTRAR